MRAHAAQLNEWQRALIRPIGHLLPCQEAQEKAIIIKGLLPFAEWEKVPEGRMRASSTHGSFCP